MNYPVHIYGPEFIDAREASGDAPEPREADDVPARTHRELSPSPVTDADFLRGIGPTTHPAPF